MRYTEELARALVRANVPRRWTVRFSADASAHVDPSRREFLLPDPKAHPDFCVFRLFHEVGHVEMKHFDHDLANHHEEFEAEQYAIGALRAHGLVVTGARRREAKRNVRLAIARDRAREVDVDEKILRWAGEPRRGDA